ncbi:tetratricopeptide repeat protein [Pontibacter burrus]|uniref:Tetratricopeptide repeat protein n=1 Tax=Pontibacter burrus TaxID=2704466 RepID=A0A6B3LPZ1_9BACT|nr:tetratricopeptide repeat protein [Pontibacter burrus]NEM97913.1 tetratricopeptide repeat protein [Pontibacter burrus]
MSFALLVYATGCNMERGTGERMVDLQHVTDDEDAQLSNLDAAISRNKQDASLYARRAKVLIRRQEYEKALSDANSAIGLNESNMGYLFLKAQVLRSLGKPNEALKLALQAERNSYQNASLYTLLSDLYLQLKQPNEAGKAARKALEFDPNNGYALYFKGKASAAIGDTTRALANYRLAVAEEPDLLEAQRELAGALVFKHQFEDAKPQLRKVKALLPKDGLVWFYQGVYYQLQQKPDSALWSYSQALKLADTLQVAHARTGILLYSRYDYAGAISHLEKAIEGNQKNIKYISALANAYERTGQNLNALEQYQRVIALQPDHALANQSINRLKAKLTRPVPFVRRDTIEYLQSR